jgi:phosphoribosylaminoimidazole (AIR) synthetase
MILKLESSTSVLNTEELLKKHFIRVSVIQNIGCGHALQIDNDNKEKVINLLNKNYIQFEIYGENINDNNRAISKSNPI